MQSSTSTARRFEIKPAVRSVVPLLVGLVGPSGSGKTYSMLELLTGFAKVNGEKVAVIDTEARRALHYADEFSFHHMPFGAPFGPLDYLAAIQYVYDQGYRNIGIDSASHEHEGPGGVLEMHQRECERLIQAWSRPGAPPVTMDKVQLPAWNLPKSERRKLLNSVLQLAGANFIWCFRAKEKVKPQTGGKPLLDLGWQPIAGEEFVFEQTVNILLPPGAEGVPDWNPEQPASKAMVKLPKHFRELFATREPLSRKHGEAMAKWAAGAEQRKAPPVKQAPPPRMREPGEDDDRPLAPVVIGMQLGMEAAEEIKATKAAIIDELRRRYPDDRRNPNKPRVLRLTAVRQLFADHHIATYAAFEDLPLDVLKDGLTALRQQ